MSSIWEPIKGKCMWWREIPNEDDRYDGRLKPEDRRVSCECFVEGRGWVYPTIEVPKDCPEARRCRYYIKAT
ncbi:MAG: hypothetical protein HY876_03135 [Coriobacteriales bacterium]|nr:hypothetical protein [Coriobacteriales bacterium]